MKEVNELKFKKITIGALLLLLVIVVEATYAFFVAQKGTGGSAQIEVGAGTTDSLTFQTGDPINISASSDDFYKGADSKTGTTTATAKLIPNNTTNEAHEKYNVYFIIDQNDFVYSTDDEQVELLLKIKGPTDEKITTLEALNYNEELDGFDITKRNGVFKIVFNDEIDADSEVGTLETWTFEVILRNLEVDQQKNTGKTFQSKVLITTEEKETYVIPEINNIVEEAKDYESITVNLMENDTHTEKIEKYYYAIEETTEEPESASIMSIAEKLEPTYIEWDEPTYKFTEIDGEPLKDNQNYKVYAYSKDIQGSMSAIKTAIIKTDLYNHLTVTGFTSESDHHTIKVTASSTPGDNPVKEYAFMIEGHEKYGSWSNWQESPEFTFSELKAGYDYNIQVKARDTKNKESITSYDKRETTTPFDVIVKIINGTFVNGNGGTVSYMPIPEDYGASFLFKADDGYYGRAARIDNDDWKIGHGSYYFIHKDHVTDDYNITITIFHTTYLHQYIAGKVGTSGQGKLIKQDYSINNGPRDNSYRYSGTNPNNYVCFGAGSEEYNSGGATCPENNLYRIIGAFNSAKLIKAEYITEEELGMKSSGTPTTSQYTSLKRVKNLPTAGFEYEMNMDNPSDAIKWEDTAIFKALNNTDENHYLGKLGAEWQDLIEDTNWVVGAPERTNVNLFQIFDAEKKGTYELKGKVGLMYASEYAFASLENSWDLLMYDEIGDPNNDLRNPINIENNWLFNGVQEWTFSHLTTYSPYPVVVVSTGFLTHYHYSVAGNMALRPAFYLSDKAWVVEDSADGSINNPYRILKI